MPKKKKEPYIKFIANEDRIYNTSVSDDYQLLFSYLMVLPQAIIF